jgi:hypothetical protein
MGSVRLLQIPRRAGRHTVQVAVVLIPKQNAARVIAWLHATVSPNDPYPIPDAERTADSDMNPHHVSVTALIATWQSLDPGQWRVTQWSRGRRVEVECLDPRHETYIATRWS